jgi:hypothetical protein
MMRKRLSRGKSKRVFARSFMKNKSRRSKQAKKRRTIPRGGYRLWQLNTQ